MHIDYCAQSEGDAAPVPRRISTLNVLAEQHDDVERRIARIESGLERPEGLSLTALRMQRSGLREDIARQQRKASEGCCNCGKNCSGK